MNSRIIGKIKLNLEALKRDVIVLEKSQFSNAYKEFAYGDWKTSIIWNQDGIDSNGLIHDYRGYAKPTVFANSLKSINEIIENNFNVSKLKFARIFSVSNNGLVVPHVDYLELKQNFVRVHIPLQTSLSCLSSEKDNVFHMRLGEIWYLDASNIHSAACFSNINRLHLVLDFEYMEHVECVLRQDINPCKEILPHIIYRDDLNSQELMGILSLSEVVSEDNFRDIVSILSKIHFRKNVCSSKMFEWLKYIVYKNNKKTLINMYENLMRECLIYRDAPIVNLEVV